MSDSSSSAPITDTSQSSDAPVKPEQLEATQTELQPQAAQPEPKPSYVKLAMRNMVRKRGKSLFHFVLTTVGLLVALVGLSYLTR